MKFTQITLRKYQNEDCEAVSQLFYDTVHSVNARDYSEEQLFAWAKDGRALLRRQADLSKQRTLVAETDAIIVGFGSITDTGFLDMLFTHRDYQGQGIATAIAGELERGFSAVTTYASITAKPFFEKRGYAVMKTQEVERFGVKLKNYAMIKK